MNNTVTSSPASANAPEPSFSAQQASATDNSGPGPHLGMVKRQNLVWIMIIVAVAAVLLMVFSYLLHQQLPMDFPGRAGPATRGDVARHYLDAQD